MLLPLTPKNHSVQSLLTDWQQQFYIMHDAIPAEFREGNQSWCQIKPNSGDCSFPRPVLFSWCCDHFENKTYDIHISKTPDLAEEHKVAVWDALCQAVYNLEVDTKYYWYVDKTGENGYERSAVFSFSTAKEYPRAIMIPNGVSNVRDIGGITTFDHHRIRQGLLYRGEFPGTCLDQTGKGDRVFCEELGIKTVVDLRGADVCDPEEFQPVLPREKTAWYLTSVYPYEGIDYNSCYEAFRTLFQLISHRENLPLYYHCMIGVDRIQYIERGAII